MRPSLCERSFLRRDGQWQSALLLMGELLDCDLGCLGFKVLGVGFRV